MTAQPIETIVTKTTAPQHGAEVFVPLNQLKASPKNARKAPHSTAANLPPRITIRPGYAFRIILTQDLDLPPYGD